MRKADILFQTDFGMWGGAPMYGMCKIVDPQLHPYTLSHTIHTFDVAEASLRLMTALIFWPEGTVFVSVVDPGVGTPRRAAAALTNNGYYIVTPDNGTLSDVNKQYGIKEIRQIDETINRYPYTPKASIFHGRGLFAYCAARLASGIISYEQAGPAYPLDEMITFKSDVIDTFIHNNSKESLPPALALIAENQPRHIVLLNDFNHNGGSAVLRGVCRKICAETEIYDVPLTAAEAVRVNEIAKDIMPYWPEDTVFLIQVNGTLAAVSNK